MATQMTPELGIFEWWISGLMPTHFLISRLNYACSPLVTNLQFNKAVGVKDISF